MAQFIHDNFVLETKTASRLYHDYAAKLPIIDFHNHLPPVQIAEDMQFDNLSDIWLGGDHYKWRAMRSNGINEKYCSGDADPKEKFQKWAETVPYVARNPLYHWTHMELTRYFGITELLNGDSASRIYDEATAKLRTKEYSVQGLLKMMNVEAACTTDDPIDSLQYHKAMKGNTFTKVLPTFRPDKMVNIAKPGFKEYIQALGEVVGSEIKSFDALVDAADQRHAFFHEVGCRLSDHGLDRWFFAKYTASEVEAAFKKAMAGESLSAEEAEKFSTAMFTELCKLNHKRGWTQQFHIGAIRNNNERMFAKMGPDTGFDSIGDWKNAENMSAFLNNLDSSDQLAKSILYNLNPAENEVYATMIGNFQDGSVAGKMQYGSGWWFLDQKYGMEKQMNDLSLYGLLSRFVGMVTDSRSFLSFPRHEYFRRILCNLLGNDVEKGLLPNDEAMLKMVVEGVCYKNASQYFGF